jgi:CYTH domain-containing protein
LITSIYLREQEFAVLATALTGARISKLRHRLRSPSGIALAIDEFQGEIAGLLVAEAEFDSDDLMRNFLMPDFALRHPEAVKYSSRALKMACAPSGPNCCGISDSSGDIAI